jgi:subtilisin family serine protease
LEVLVILARKSLRAGSLILLCTMLLHASVEICAADDYALNQAIVRLTPAGNIDLINQIWGTSVIDSIPSRRVYLLELSNPSLLDTLISVLDQAPEVVFADYNYNDSSPESRHLIVIVVIGSTGQDVEDQGAVARVRADEANAVSSGAGTRVAVLDTGAELDHPYLQGHLDTLNAWDYVEGDAHAEDSANGVDDDGDGLTDGGAGHGTMVAGVIRTIAPGALILPIRVLNDEGRGTVFMVTQGIFRALEADADVINLSLGTTSYSDAIHDALVAARAVGVPVVAAAGNDSANTAHYPARDSLAFAITATDSADVKADLANYALEIDLCAPGVGILSSYLDGAFGIGTGTSFAAPFASATLALLRSMADGAFLDSVQQWTMDGSANVNSIPENQAWLGMIGAGRVDCYGAVELASAATAVATTRPALAGAIANLSNAPNPFRSETTIRFTLSREAFARLEVYSVEGRALRASTLGRLVAGAHAHALRAVDDDGRALAPGTYAYRIISDAGGASGRFTILR